MSDAPVKTRICYGQMEALELTKREQFVLTSIIEKFVASANPVGSKLIESDCHGAISSATIRNVMSELELRGFVKQPHTSAGRMPTDKGYRFYVDTLMPVQALSLQEKNNIYNTIISVSKDVSDVLEAATQTLARISSQLGLGLAPRFYEGIFEKIELIPIAFKKILVVISIESGFVKTITLEIDKDISRERLEETARIINERLSGLSLKEIKKTIDRRLSGLLDSENNFIDFVINSSGKIFADLSPNDLHLGGTANIMSLPEFSDHQSIVKIMELIDDKEILIHLMSDENSVELISENNIRITIGEENKKELVSHCSLITTTYEIGNISGRIGIIGPTRMNYSKLVVLVDYMSKVLTDVFKMNND
ncbi:MAG: heat-inducible transcription repressor HrcA [Calditrichaeota bacterium]|nr:MAG: heat-inducible transcription repressor HrcA [Calditrichota bacterium]